MESNLLMRKFRIIPLILIICTVFTVMSPGAYALEYPTINAQAYVVADMVSGNILYSKNMDEQRSPASLTKIMTGLIAIEAIESGRVKADDIITAASDCRTGLDEESSTVGIQPGEEMSFKDLVYCALVHSANEACNVIATAVSGSIEAFVAEMNAKAIEIGATHTKFLDTNGLTNDVNNHHTTAYDLYIIANEAMKHPQFAAIVNTSHYTVPATNMSGERELSNSNALICEDGFYGPNYIYEGAKGIKTGYTRAAGYCLVSTASRSDVQILCVVMGCDGWLNAQVNDYGNFSTTIKLYNWAFENFSYRTVITAGDAVDEVEVQYAADGKKAVLRAAETERLLIPNDTVDENVIIDYTVYEDKLVAPIEPKTILGEAQIYVNGTKSGTFNLVTMDSVALDKSEVFKTSIRNFFSAAWVKIVIIVIIAALAIYLFLLVRYRIRKQKRARARAAAQERKRKEAQLQRNRAKIEAQKWENEQRAQRQAQQRQYYSEQSTSYGDETRSYSSGQTPITRELNQDELDDIIRSLGLDKKDW